MLIKDPNISVVVQWDPEDALFVARCAELPACVGWDYDPALALTRAYDQLNAVARQEHATTTKVVKLIRLLLQDAPFKKTFFKPKGTSRLVRIDAYGGLIPPILKDHCTGLRINLANKSNNICNVPLNRAPFSTDTEIKGRLCLQIYGTPEKKPDRPFPIAIGLMFV